MRVYVVGGRHFAEINDLKNVFDGAQLARQASTARVRRQ